MAITTNNLISRQTVGSAGAATVTFSNIPQTFTDLVLKVSSRSNRSDVNDGFFVYLNGSTSSITAKRLYGNSSSGSVDSGSSVLNDANTATASVFANSEIYIPNYASANYKSFSVDTVTENNSSTNAFVSIVAVLWSNTAAVTSLTLTNETGTAFMEYSTFSLYGISSNTSTQNTSIPLATGGDVITTDGTYWYHAFKYSGTFTPLKALTADCLVVAGGGGTSTQAGGGGGAGGLVYQTGRTVASAATVTVGAGGIGDGYGSNGVSGGNSVFDTITAVGGAGGPYTAAGLSGGSGSGASYNAGAGGSATQGNSGGGTGYGNAGAGGTISGNQGAGGGGGAGAAGSAGTSSVGGNGGVGLTNSTINTLNAFGAATSTGQLSGGNYYYAGGGGGGVVSGSTAGTGGLGGGGTGGQYTNVVRATNGTANTGGGGGGGGANTTGWANGGSGIVLIRYVV